MASKLFNLEIIFLLALILFSCNRESSEYNLKDVRSKKLNAKNKIYRSDLTLGLDTIAFDEISTKRIEKRSFNGFNNEKYILEFIEKIDKEIVVENFLPSKVIKPKIKEIGKLTPKISKIEQGESKENRKGDAVYFKTNSSLLSDDIREVHADQKGRLWIGSWGSGISIYDGSYTKTFNDQNGFVAERILSFCSSNKSDMWIGSWKNGLIKYSPDKGFTQFDFRDSTRSSDKIQHLHEDKEQNLWIASSFGLFKFDGQKFLAYADSNGLNSSVVYSVKPLNENLYIGTNQGLNILKGSVLYKLKNKLLKNKISSIEISNAGHLLIGTNQGLLICRGDSLFRFRPEKLGTQIDVNDIYLSDDNSLTVSTTADGIIFITDTYFSRFDSDFGLPSNSFHSSTMIDKVIFGAPYEQGISKNRLNYFGSFGLSDNLSSKNYKGFYKNGSNELWLSSWYKGIDIIEDDSISTLYFSDKPKREFVRKMIDDKDGYLWVLTYSKGLIRLDKDRKSGRRYLMKNGFPSNTYMHAVSDNSGALWMGTDGGGVLKIENNKLHVIKGTLNQNCWNLLYDSYRNCIWAVSHGEGLNKITQDSIYYYTEKEGLVDNEINYLYQDDQGIIWIGYEGRGVQCLNREDFIYEPSIILNNPYVKSIIQDKNRTIWFSTENGLESAAPIKSKDGKFRHNVFNSKRDGLITNSYSLNAFFDLNDTLFWGGSDGISFVLPNWKKIIEKDIQISYIKVNNEIRTGIDPELESISLGYRQNSIEIGLTNIDFRGTNSQYYYQLEGMDDRWIPIENDKIILSHIQQGDFKLNIRGETNSNKTTLLEIMIAPPFWLSFWMKSLYALFFCLIVFLILKWRTRRLILNQKRLENQINEATRAIQDQKKKILAQHSLLEESHDKLESSYKEIQDSITYAKRIQNAILPTNEMIHDLLPNSFVIYEPKDIVSGDFYWVNEVEAPLGSKQIFFAVADCTGHGVPGAMISVICNNSLNKAIFEYGLTDPGDILNQTRETIISEFQKSEEQVMDGMDIALCTLKNNVLYFSGANNPLWIVRKESEELEIHKGDKQPVGNYVKNSNFTSHKIELNEGDQIYIFSDGYADQFGGDFGKKFKTSQLKELILNLRDQPLHRQKEILLRTFKKWKGGYEQLDDICIIGYRYESAV